MGYKIVLLNFIASVISNKKNPNLIVAIHIFINIAKATKMSNQNLRQLDGFIVYIFEKYLIKNATSRFNN